LGLFLAGASSAGLFIVIHGRLRTRFGRLMIYSGYLLFAPIGLMTALLVPGPVEFATTVSLLGLLLMAPMTTVILGNVAVAIGLAITGGLAVISNALAQRVGANNDMSFEPIRLRR
jgi:galactitol-specific phosphotransferase system IIC component